MKIGLIGAGAVGRACLMSLAYAGGAREIVLVNRNHKRAQGMVADIQYGTTLLPAVHVRAGHYEDLDQCRLVIVTVGVNEKTGGATDRSDDAGRLRLLDDNAKIYQDIIPKVNAAAPGAIILVVTDPPDPLAEVARQYSNAAHVISSGTLLDSQRMRFHIARHAGVHPASVEAMVLGEHGTSQVFVWSGVRIGGVPLARVLDVNEKDCEAFQKKIEEEVRFANISIIEGTGASQLGIGMVTAHITRTILNDENLVVPIGSHIQAYETTLSLPSLLGKEGVLETYMPALSAREEDALAASARVIRQAWEGVA